MASVSFQPKRDFAYDLRLAYSQCREARGGERMRAGCHPDHGQTINE